MTYLNAPLDGASLQDNWRAASRYTCRPSKTRTQRPTTRTGQAKLAHSVPLHVQAKQNSHTASHYTCRPSKTRTQRPTTRAGLWKAKQNSHTASHYTCRPSITRTQRLTTRADQAKLAHTAAALAARARKWPHVEWSCTCLALAEPIRTP